MIREKDREVVEDCVEYCKELFKKYNIEDWGIMYFKVLRNFLSMFIPTENQRLFRQVINELIKDKTIIKKRQNKRYIYEVNLSGNIKKRKKNIKIEW